MPFLHCLFPFMSNFILVLRMASSILFLLFFQMMTTILLASIRYANLAYIHRALNTVELSLPLLSALQCVLRV